jgi:beta-xylosidase
VPTIAGPSYQNPVYDHDFPDPHAILVGDGYYAYATNTGSTNLPVIQSHDLVSWQPVGDAMTALPSWATLNFGDTWAPGVIQVGDAFVMFFVDHDKTSGRQCIGVATATMPAGPFHDGSDKPFICQADLGGSIDPYPFADTDGTLYLFWKNDGNCCGREVDIWVQPLSADGLTLRGQPTKLIQRDQAWENPLIENPAVVFNGDKYYLFYSANRWDSRDYAVGYAVCDAVTGPCVKPQDGPILQATNDARGPGGESFLTDADGTLWMVYHAWTGRFVGYPAGRRSMRIDPLRFDASGKPLINGPTTDPQPLP